MEKVNETVAAWPGWHADFAGGANPLPCIYRELERRGLMDRFVDALWKRTRSLKKYFWGCLEAAKPSERLEALAQVIEQSSWEGGGDEA